MSGLRVMVVTDYPAFRDVVCGVVEGRGFQAFPATDGIDALRQIYHVMPRVIISDAALPNLAGFDLLNFVRRRFPEIGIIALSDKRRADEGTKVLADIILAVDSFDPQLLGDALVGLVEDFPHRTPKTRGTRALARPSGSADGGSSACARCEQLQREASLARMNSLLARVWARLHPEDKGAERQETEADVALSHVSARLQEHQVSSHGARPGASMASGRATDQKALRYANR